MRESDVRNRRLGELESPWRDALGIRSDVRLHLEAPAGDPAAARLSLPGTGRSFVLLEAAEEGRRGVPCALRIFEATDAERLAAGRREFHLRAEMGRAPAGLLPGLPHLQSPGEPVLLPPTYLCREIGSWIPVVCPGCDGPAPESSDGPCPDCGSPGPTGGGSGEDPLHRLAARVRQGSAPERLPLACTDCRRREACFPEAGPESPGAASSVLTPVSETPWLGMLCDRFDRTFPEFCAEAGVERLAP